MTIILRDVAPEDEPFLREVYACTRAQELSIVPWTDEQREAFLRFQFYAQDSHYRSQYPEASFQIVLDDGNAVGRIYLAREPTEIRILDITILPQFRSAGIGTSLIRSLLTEADENNQVVTIWVEHSNPSLALFQRMGFVTIREDGYNNLMEYRGRAKD